MAAVLLVDKPKGITSFDVIRILRTRLGVKKMGHAGTLDPLASGLMIVATEGDTKKLNEFLKLPKTYEAVVRLGERRTTGDTEGEVLALCAVPDIPAETIEQALRGMEGSLRLPVPAYSAIKQGGEPLYKKVRRGDVVKPPTKEMVVRRAALHAIARDGDFLHLHATFDVGSGTYIRSLAEALGERLGYPATLAGLRRTRVGDFSIDDDSVIRLSDV